MCKENREETDRPGLRGGPMRALCGLWASHPSDLGQQRHLSLSQPQGVSAKVEPWAELEVPYLLPLHAAQQTVNKSAGTQIGDRTFSQLPEALLRCLLVAPRAMRV